MYDVYTVYTVKHKRKLCLCLLIPFFGVVLSYFYLSGQVAQHEGILGSWTRHHFPCSASGVYH